MRLFDIFRKKEPEAVLVIAPGEVRIEREWRDDPMTDTTVIAIGGQVHPEKLEAIRAILSGEAHASRYGRKRKRVMAPDFTVRREGVL